MQAREAMVFCNCGKVPILRTSWTNQNPGRRFFACPEQVGIFHFGFWFWCFVLKLIYTDTLQGSSCRFFCWYDPVMCDRAKDVIPGLLRAKNSLEVRLKASQEKTWRLKMMLIASWVGFVAFVMYQ